MLNAIKQMFESAQNSQFPYTVDVCEVRETWTVGEIGHPLATVRKVAMRA